MARFCIFRPIMALVMLGCVSNAYAWDYRYSLYSVAELSDNIQQAAGEDQGLALDYGADLIISSNQNQALLYSISGLVGRTEYHGSDLATEERRNLEARLLFDPSRANYSLLLMDSFRQVKRDRESAQSVNNLSDINVVSIIPSYEWVLSETDELNFNIVGSKISDLDAESAIEDASRTSLRGSIGYDRAMSSTLTVGLYYRESEIEYDVEGEDYTSKDGLIRFSSLRGATRFDLNYGRLEVETETGQIEEADVIEFTLSRQINRRNLVGVIYRTGLGQEVNLDYGDATYDHSINENSAFLDGLTKEEQGEINYFYDGYEFNLSLELYRRKLTSFDFQPLRDEEGSGGVIDFSIDIGRYFGRSVESNISVEYAAETFEFNQTAVEYDSDQYALRFDYGINREIMFYSEVSHRTTEGNLAFNNSTENRVIVGLRYSPRGRSDMNNRY